MKDVRVLAGRLVDASGAPGGVCVVLGREDADLAVEISKRGRFVVHALYPDRETVDKARASIRSRGACGWVSADASGCRRLPYARNLVNVIVADGFPELKGQGLSLKEVKRVLCPLGAAFFAVGDAANDAAGARAGELKSALGASGFVGAEVIQPDGTWVKAVRPWPDEIDEWTHYLHGADGNPVANDHVVGPPRRQQWVSGPRWLRSHETVSSVATIVTARGRLFYIVDEAPISLPGKHELPDKWALVARDAFNGVKLWRVPIDRWGWREWKTSWFSPRPGDYPFNIQKRLVAAGDRVYVTLGYHAPVSELDARTGELLKTYEGTEDTVEFIHARNVLVCSVLRNGALKLSAVDAAGGKRLWTTRESYRGVTTDYLRWRAMRGAIKPPDRLAPTLNTATDGNIVAFLDGSSVVAVSFTDGTEKWRAAFPEKGPKSPVKGLPVRGLWVGTTIVKDGCVLHASPSTLACFSASDGKLRWTRPKRYLGHLWYEWKDVFVIDGLAWTWSERLVREPLSALPGRTRPGQPNAPAGRKAAGRSSWPETVNGYDIRTGTLVRKVDLGRIFKTHHHHRCYRNKATVRYILASRRGTEYVDLREGRHSVHNWVRGACHVGMMPANGLHYAPPHPCVCYSAEKLNGMNALAPAPPEETKATAEDPGRTLERGPAWGGVEGPPAQDEDWPTYRHDIGRSGSVRTKLPSDAGTVWRVQLGDPRPAGAPEKAVLPGRGPRGGPPVCVAGRIFIPLVDAHRLVALDARSGEKLWEFAAGARLDSPPTYFRGALVFGSRDGRVYSVRAADGALAWRLRAAPRERLVGAFGQLESAWPVHGSVLVLDGIAYFAAGRSSYLDGGLYLYGVDAATGEVRHRARLRGPDYTVENIKQNYRLPMGTLPDIMQSDGSSIFMRDASFDPDLKRRGGVPKLRTGGGFLDDTYFKRMPWRHPSCGYGRLIVHDDQRAYCVRMFDSLEGLNPSVYFTPGAKGYLLTAHETTKRASFAKASEPAVRSFSEGGRAARWSHRVRIRVRAMVATEGALCIAGPPDVVDTKDPLGAFEGRKGGVLRVLAADSGEKIAEHKLDSPPVFNGMAAAAGRLYIVTEDGGVVCIGGK